MKAYELGGYTYYSAPFWLLYLLCGMGALVNATSPNCVLERYLIGSGVRVSKFVTNDKTNTEQMDTAWREPGLLTKRNVDSVENKVLLASEQTKKQNANGKEKEKAEGRALSGVLFAAASGALTSAQLSVVQVVRAQGILI